jgi:hypothetical protein
MTPTEIITADAQRNGVDPRLVLGSIKPDLVSKKATLIQSGDSVLVVKMISKDVAELHLFTVEPIRTLIESIKEFISQIKQSGIEIVYGNADNEMILKILESAGVLVTESDREGYNWKANVWAQ